MALHIRGTGLRQAFRVLSLAGLIALIGLFFVAPASADKRIALVVGNSAYQNVRRLENPRNDALLMAKTLQGLGFTLVGNGAQLDLDKAGFDNAVQSFGVQIQGADVALFYYAGHGLQVAGSNYLVPVNANPTREADVDFQMMDVNLVLRQMQDSRKRLNLVILDACRNNPFGGRGLGRAADGGLAQMRAPAGTLISYATQPGNVAQDGVDGDSPYTKALAAAIGRSGLDIFQTFNQVGLDVENATGGSQQPWMSNSPIDGSFSFAPSSSQGSPTQGLPTQVVPPAAPPQRPAETTYIPPPPPQLPPPQAPPPYTTAAASPSFPCGGSLSADEQTVCGNATLAMLDRQLDSAFSAAKATAADRAALNAAEKAWVGQRRGCGTNEACIAALYQSRISQLESNAPYAATPSFSCSGRLAADEQAICGNPTLSALDRQLNAAFEAAKGSPSQPQLMRDQKNWLAQRSQCYADTACLTSVYQLRISQLRR